MILWRRQRETIAITRVLWPRVFQVPCQRVTHISGVLRHAKALHAVVWCQALVSPVSQAIPNPAITANQATTPNRRIILNLLMVVQAEK